MHGARQRSKYRKHLAILGRGGGNRPPSAQWSGGFGPQPEAEGSLSGAEPPGPLAPWSTSRYLLPMVSDPSPPRLRFNEQGLLPAVVQDRLTGEVRMVAWMNAEALDHTLRTRKATFYSRSRQSLWVKGETSGHELRVHRVVADCDGDTLLVLCDPIGPSCHTGRDTCFFYELFGPEEPAEEPAGAPPAEASSPRAEPLATSLPALPLFGELERVLESRKASSGEKSYTRALLDGGSPKIGGKIREEADELATALANESDDRVASEAADVLYHLLVGLRYRGIPWRRVLAVLAGRFGMSGHAEKAARGKTTTNE